MDAVKVNDITLAPGGIPLIQNFNFCFEPGHITRLTGPNGSGKSTLLKTIARLHTPLKGNIPDYGPALLLTHQNLLNAHLTVRENLDFWCQFYASPAASKEKAVETLGLSRLLDLLPHKLSQGQQKRGQLSLLFFHPARIWLLDEPLNSLDDKYTSVLGHLMQEFQQTGGITVYASHTPILGCTETTLDMTAFGPRRHA